MGGSKIGRKGGAILDAMLAGKSHRADPAAGYGFQQRLLHRLLPEDSLSLLIFKGSAIILKLPRHVK